MIDAITIYGVIRIISTAYYDSLKTFLFDHPF